LPHYAISLLFHFITPPLSALSYFASDIMPAFAEGNISLIETHFHNTEGFRAEALMMSAGPQAFMTRLLTGQLIAAESQQLAFRH
jgi:hypothetical protein